MGEDREIPRGVGDKEADPLNNLRKLIHYYHYAEFERIFGNNAIKSAIHWHKLGISDVLRGCSDDKISTLVEIVYLGWYACSGLQKVISQPHFLRVPRKKKCCRVWIGWLFHPKSFWM